MIVTNAGQSSGEQPFVEAMDVKELQFNLAYMF